jgi:hypothetical protein
MENINDLEYHKFELNEIGDITTKIVDWWSEWLESPTDNIEDLESAKFDDDWKIRAVFTT